MMGRVVVLMLVVLARLIMPIAVLVNAHVNGHPDYYKPSDSETPILMFDSNSSISVDFRLIKVPEVIAVTFCMGVAIGACAEFAKTPPALTLCTAIGTQNCLKLFSVSIFDCSLACTHSITNTLGFHHMGDRVEEYLETCYKRCKNY